jgi:hypothetical protein
VKAGNRGFHRRPARRKPAVPTLALTLVAFLSITLAAQPPQQPAPPAQAPTANPASPEDTASAPAARSPEMQVSQTDGLHVPPRTRRALHGRVYESHSNSVFGARAFFQVGGLKPAHDNQYGFAVEAPLWRGSFLTLDTNQQKTRGMVNGNVLVPLPSESIPLATDPALRTYVQLILNAYPDEIPNRTDIDPRMLNTNSPQRVDGQIWNTHFDQRIGSRDNANDGRVTWRRDWTAATSTSATVAFDRTASMLAPSKDNLGSSINVGGLQGLGPSPDVPAYRADNLFRQGVQVRHAHGVHTFVFGFEISRRQYNGYRSGSSRPDIAFIADSQNDAITNLRLGLPYSMAESINLFNTAQFAAPDNMLTDSSFGAITNTLNNGRSLRFGASFEFCCAAKAAPSIPPRTPILQRPALMGEGWAGRRC